MERARRAALALGERLGELGLPVFVYAPPGARPGVLPAAAASTELQRRIDAGELAPDFGPAQLDPSAGGVIVGARRPLIAFNVNLRGSLEAAREIADARARARRGGFPGVRALGLELPRGRPRPGLDERRGLGGGRAARDRRRGSPTRRSGAGRRWSARSSSA